MRTDWLESATYAELVQFMREEPPDSEFFRNAASAKAFWNALDERVRSRMLDDIPVIREFMGWKHAG